MDPFDFNNVKAERRNTMPTHTLFTGIAKTLRILELCIALLLLSWILTRLPLALRFSADYLRKLSASPLFVFAVSNAIIATLVAQYGRFSTSHFATSPSEPDSAAPWRVAVSITEEEEHRNKQVKERAEINTSTEIIDSGSVRDSDVLKDYRRSQSEKLKGEDEKKTGRRRLRRSETVMVRENLYPHDKLSNEEFRRTIEAFIAKQMRFLREEL